MNLIILAVVIAVCGGAKLDRTYLPPASAKTAGGSPGAIRAPNSFSQNSAPKGSYDNEFQGVVVDAALADTRASGSEETGLGGPRNSYGSTASKVGDAAFRGSQAGFRFPVSSQDEFESNSQFGASIESEDDAQFAAPRGSQNIGVSKDSTPENSQTFGVSREAVNPQSFDQSRPERPQAAQERAAGTLRFDSEVGAENYNYAYETDNGISAEESGTAVNGVQAQGSFSYTGDDGKVYSVTYTADEGGYRPRGDHLPTPPPIPEEILKSLEQNARDEANGVIDDGLYDAEKYNRGDYAESDSANGKQNSRPSVTAVTGNADVDASGSFINQNNLPFNPNQRQRDNEDKTQVNRFQSTSNGANGNSQSNGNRFGSRNEYLPPLNNQIKPQHARPQIPTTNTVIPDTDPSSFQQELTEESSGNFHSNTQQAQSRPGSSHSATRPINYNKFDGFKQNVASNANQFKQNVNRFPSSQGNRQQIAATQVNTPHYRDNQFSPQPDSSSFNSQHTTSVPDTELTTPFESSPHQSNAQPSAPTVTVTNVLGSNTQPSRSVQSNFGFQNAQQETSQALAQPTVPSFAQSRPQHINNRPMGFNRNSQYSLPNQATQIQNQQSQFANKHPQLPQNHFSQNFDGQFSSGTQKPQLINQGNANQDDSYYYNQPSKVFNTPQTQDSRFPSAPSNQFNRVTQQPSQGTEEENYPSTPFPSRNGQRQGSRYPKPSNVPAESTPSDNQYHGNAISSTANGITQASVSSFAALKGSMGFKKQQFGQPMQQFQQNSFQTNRVPSSEANKSFGAQTTPKPQTNRGQSHFEQQNFETAQPLSQQPLQDVKQPHLDAELSQAVTNQQYNGEIYEYNKPAETLPPPESGFGQFGTKVQSSKPTPSRPQFSPSSTDETQKPEPEFGSSSNGFIQSSTTSQDNKFQSQSQFGQASMVQFGQQMSESLGSKPMRFRKPAHVSQNDQFSAQTSAQEHTSDELNAQPSTQKFGTQENEGTVEQSINNQFSGQRRPLSSQAAVSKPFAVQNGRMACCNAFGQPTFAQATAPRQFGEDRQIEQQNSFQSSSGLRPEQKQSVAGKAEIFGGPRKPPSFDESGYHY